MPAPFGRNIKKGGIEAIKPGKRGRRDGAQRVLGAEQEVAVQNMLVDKAPNQLKLPLEVVPFV